MKSFIVASFAAAAMAMTTGWEVVTTTPSTTGWVPLPTTTPSKTTGWEVVTTKSTTTTGWVVITTPKAETWAPVYTTPKAETWAPVVVTTKPAVTTSTWSPVATFKGAADKQAIGMGAIAIAAVAAML